MKKFFAVIGNPPYQDESSGEQKNFAPPIYNSFMDEAYKVAEKVTLVTPARFLFNAGSTPKKWNEKMLADKHLKVLKYVADGSTIFPNTDIKGGVAVTYRDESKDYGAIGTFTAFEELQAILKKLQSSRDLEKFSDIVFPESKFNLEVLYKDFPMYKQIIGSDGNDKRFRSNAFEKLEIFSDKKKQKDVEIHGLIKNKRCVRFIDRKYLAPSITFEKYKVLVPQANGSGELGEVLSNPIIAMPFVGYTGSFIGIGAFDTKYEATACMKYIKTKFARALLGTLKITHHNEKATWSNVPLQDFTSKSDIDWTKSVHEIDLQLYKKYGLSKEEKDFIETHVKEMV